MEIISTRDVDTQEQLLEELNAAGFHTTQATISRDIKELRIVKELTTFGTYRYTSSAKDVAGSFSNRLNNIFRQSIISYDFALNQVVVHTIPGLAPAAASAVDAMGLHSVLGCIAGDDTVLIIMRDNHSAAAFCNEIKSLLE
jgi:transcriptional regulator of arginine metabolism